jgi:hypothetical protein
MQPNDERPCSTDEFLFAAYVALGPYDELERAADLADAISLWLAGEYAKATSGLDLEDKT